MSCRVFGTLRAQLLVELAGVLGQDGRYVVGAERLCVLRVSVDLAIGSAGVGRQVLLVGEEGGRIDGLGQILGAAGRRTITREAEAVAVADALERVEGVARHSHVQVEVGIDVGL